MGVIVVQIPQVPVRPAYNTLCT